MEYISTLIVVKDIEKSKDFYKKVLGLEVVDDFGQYVTFSDGVSLQTIESWKGFIHKEDDDLAFKNNVWEFYFEEDDIDNFVAKLSNMVDIEYVHPLIEHSWGQRVIRFYDPDKHIIEVGEKMVSVVKRHIKSGLSAEETAKHMDVPIDFVKSCINHPG